MLLVDTSIWIDHFRTAVATLSAGLRDRRIAIHAFVLGELSLGHLPNVDLVISNLRDLPQATIASPDEVLHLIRSESLSGTGIGYVDAHLLASARVTPAMKLWTRDRRLLKVAERLQIASDLR